MIIPYFSAIADVDIVSPLEYGPSRKSTSSSVISRSVRLAAVSGSPSSSYMRISTL